MATVVLYHEPNAYNIIHTGTGEICFDGGVSLEALKEWWKEEFGRRGVWELENIMLPIVQENGASSHTFTPKDYVGEYNSERVRTDKLSMEQFIAKYLTVQD